MARRERGFHRRQPREFETDPLPDRVERPLRLFFCLPFAHSEDLPEQDISVLLNAKLCQPWLGHAEGHRDIIRRFGRFPHRNSILGRTTMPEEAEFLKRGGFQG